MHTWTGMLLPIVAPQKLILAARAVYKFEKSSWGFSEAATGSSVVGAPDSLEGGWNKVTLEAAAFGLAIGGGAGGRRRSRKGVLK